MVKWDQAENIQDWQNRIGRPIDYIAGLQSDDLFRTQADLDALPVDYTVYGAVPQLGWVRYKDNSGPDGVPDSKIDDWDKVALYEHSSPPISYGLRLGFDWKGFNFETFFQGLTGHYKLPNMQPPYPWTRVYDYWSDSWTPNNTDGTMPMSNFNYWQNRAASDLYYEKAGFLRLKYMQVGYTLPVNISQKVKAQSIRVFVSGTNLLTFTKFKAFDPELGSSTVFPLSRSITGGVSITF